MQVVMGGLRHGGRVVLSDLEGNVCRLRDYPVCPGTVTPLVRTEGERDGESLPGDVIYDLDDERDLRWQDDVTRFLVHCAGEIRRGDAQHEASVVVCGPQGEETLDLASDAFMPMVDVDCNAVDHGYVFDEKLAGVIAGDRSCQLGVLDAWSDERGSHEAVIGPRPYKRRPEQVVVLDETFWEGNRAWMLDLLGQGTPGFLCLHFVFDGTDDGTVGSMPGLPAEQVHADHRLSSFSDRHPVAFHMALMVSILLFCMSCYAAPTILIHVLSGLLGFVLAWPVCMLIAVILVCVPELLFLRRELRYARPVDSGVVR
jgi:hypothetical protein